MAGPGKTPLKEFLVGKNFQARMNLKGVVTNSSKDVRKAMGKAAAMLQRKIRKVAKVDTGFMKANTTVRAVTGGKKPRMEVRSTDYAIYLDQGTFNIAPDFFITGTMAQERGRIEKLVGRAVKKEQAKREKKATRRRRRRKS